MIVREAGELEIVMVRKGDKVKKRRKFDNVKKKEQGEVDIVPKKKSEVLDKELAKSKVDDTSKVISTNRIVEVADKVMKKELEAVGTTLGK